MPEQFLGLQLGLWSNTSSHHPSPCVSDPSQQTSGCWNQPCYTNSFTVQLLCATEKAGGNSHFPPANGNNDFFSILDVLNYTDESLAQEVSSHFKTSLQYCLPAKKQRLHVSKVCTVSTYKLHIVFHYQ